MADPFEDVRSKLEGLERSAARLQTAFDEERRTVNSLADKLEVADREIAVLRLALTVPPLGSPRCTACGCPTRGYLRHADNAPVFVCIECAEQTVGSPDDRGAQVCALTNMVAVLERQRAEADAKRSALAIEVLQWKERFRQLRR